MGLAAGIAVSLLPSLPAQAAPVQTAAAINPTAQVLVAEGDGWSIYTDAASAKLVKVSQLFVDGVATPQLVVDCGLVTCSAYLSRSQTNWAQYNVNC